MKLFFDNTWKFGTFEFHILPFATYYRLRWKDKYGSARIECSPELKISWFGFVFGFYYQEWEIVEKINKKYYSHLFKNELLIEKIKNEED